MGAGDDEDGEPVADGQQIVTLRVRWPTRPDLALVDALARLALGLRRAGGEVRVGPVPPELVELLRFAALTDVLPVSPAVDAAASSPTLLGGTRQLVVNLAVADVARSRAFYGALGFTVDEAFSDDTATCLVVNEATRVVLLDPERFRACGAVEASAGSSPAGTALSLTCADRAEVETMVRTALDHGGAAAQPWVERGLLFGWSFADPDGHHWELFGIDPTLGG